MSKYIDKHNPPVNPEDLKRLHYLCGLTLCATQQFEYGLKYLLFLLSAHGIISISLEDAEEIVDGHKKKTLGQIFHDLKQMISFPDNILSDTENAINLRNEFIHGFYLNNSELIADPKTRNEVIRKVKEIRQTLIKADTNNEMMLESLFNLFGIITWEDLMKNNYKEVKDLNDQ